ncbi:MAG: 3'-5' exonuclease [Methylobacter sp.]
MNDLMIDLETLSTRPDAAIISIGAAYFDIKTGEIGDTFYMPINLTDTPEFGHISAETVKWWLKQNEEARNAITDADNYAEIPYALNEFNKFLRPGTKLWSNGSSFDLVILRSAYARCGYKTPWNYWDERDTRTIVDIASRISGVNAAKSIPFSGDKHNALADAIHQATYVSKAFVDIKTL